MRKITLTKKEKLIEENLDQFVSVTKKEQEEIANSIAMRKKNAVLNIRINSNDIKTLKQKAQKLGIKYQTFISEILHKEEVLATVKSTLKR